METDVFFFGSSLTHISGLDWCFETPPTWKEGWSLKRQKRSKPLMCFRDDLKKKHHLIFISQHYFSLWNIKNSIQKKCSFLTGATNNKMGTLKKLYLSHDVDLLIFFRDIYPSVFYKGPELGTQRGDVVLLTSVKSDGCELFLCWTVSCISLACS